MVDTEPKAEPNNLQDDDAARAFLRRRYTDGQWVAMAWAAEAGWNMALSLSAFFAVWPKLISERGALSLPKQESENLSAAHLLVEASKQVRPELPQTLRQVVALGTAASNLNATIQVLLTQAATIEPLIEDDIEDLGDIFKSPIQAASAFVLHAARGMGITDVSAQEMAALMLLLEMRSKDGFAQDVDEANKSIDRWGKVLAVVREKQLVERLDALEMFVTDK